jgi:hypothetical protein
VILLANDPVPTPWPVNFSDYVVRNEEDLIMLLEELKIDYAFNYRKLGFCFS